MSRILGEIIPYIPGEEHGDVSMITNGNDPLVALVVAELAEDRVNLVVFDANGNHHIRVNVPIHEDDGKVIATFLPVTEAAATQAHDSEADDSAQAPEPAAQPAPGTPEQPEAPAAVEPGASTEPAADTAAPAAAVNTAPKVGGK